MLLSKATYREYICRKRDGNISLWYIKIRIEQGFKVGCIIAGIRAEVPF